MPANNEIRNINLFGNMLSLKQDIFDAVHPIGETYTQYPQQDPPATVYNKNGITSEWEPISYDGAFFRAEGTNANPFTEKGTALNVQGDMVKSHTHGMEHYHYTNITHEHNYHNNMMHVNMTMNMYTGAGDASHLLSVPGVYGSIYEVYNMGDLYGYSEVVVDKYEGSKYSGGSISNEQSTPRTLTDSNNSSAFENRPKNYTIRIWRRIR